MNDNKEYQSELFNEFSEEPAKQRRFIKRLERQKQITLVISREKLIFSVISVILLYVIFFSLGIERGKKIANRSMKQDANSALITTPTSEIDTQSKQLAAKGENTTVAQENVSNLEVITKPTEAEETVPN